MNTREGDGCGPCRLSSGGESHPLDELLSDIQLGSIELEPGQFGIDELPAKQLICRQTGQDLKFRRREFQCDR